MTKKNGTKKRAVRVPNPTRVTTERTPEGLEYPVQVNFTEAHREQVRAAAVARGLSLSAFIRQAAIEASTAKS